MCIYHSILIAYRLQSFCEATLDFFIHLYRYFRSQKLISYELQAIFTIFNNISNDFYHALSSYGVSLTPLSLR